jgi:hypothetical protein
MHKPTKDHKITWLTFRIKRYMFSCSLTFSEEETDAIDKNLHTYGASRVSSYENGSRSQYPTQPLVNIYLGLKALTNVDNEWEEPKLNCSKLGAFLDVVIRSEERLSVNKKSMG